MHIAVSLLFRAAGGSLKNIAQLLQAWAADGTFERHRVTLFASAESAERVAVPSHPNLRVETLVPRGAGLAARLGAETFVLPRALSAARPDIVYAPGGTVPAGLRLPVATNFQNVLPLSPRLREDTGTWATFARMRLLGRGFRQALDRTSLAIFNSDSARAAFARWYGRPLPPARVVVRALEPSGAGTEAAVAPSLVAAVRARHGLQNPYVLAVNHLLPYKRMPELVAAFGILVAQGAADGLDLVIAGDPTVPSAARAVAARAASLGLGTRVRLLGGVPPDDVAGLLGGARAFAFLSTCENCPNGLLEAMAAGLPIVCSDRSAMPEFAGDAVLSVDPLDPRAIAASFARLLADPALAAELGRRARARVAALPGVAEMARATLAAITDAAALGPRHP